MISYSIAKDLYFDQKIRFYLIYNNQNWKLIIAESNELFLE